MAIPWNTLPPRARDLFRRIYRYELLPVQIKDANGQHEDRPVHLYRGSESGGDPISFGTVSPRTLMALLKLSLIEAKDREHIVTYDLMETAALTWDRAVESGDVIE